MTYMIRALQAEGLKLKRTLALWLALIAPLSIMVLQLMIFLESGESQGKYDPTMWQAFSRSSVVYWTLLMLPLFAALECALVAGLDHGNNGWKHLYALPIPRSFVCAAKHIVSWALIGLSMFLLAVLIPPAGLLLNLLRPELGVGTDVPWGFIVKNVALAFAAAPALIALNGLVSLRSRNMIAGLGFGIVMTVAGMPAMSSRYGPYYPTTAPTLLLGQLAENVVESWWPLWAMIAAGVLVAMVSSVWVQPSANK